MRREFLKHSAGWILCAAAWVACGGEKTVTNKELGIEITFPKAWNPEERLIKDGGVVTAKSPVAPGAKTLSPFTILIFRAKYDTLQAFADSQISVMKDDPVYENFQKTELKLGEINAFKVAFESFNQQAKVRFSHVVYYVKAPKHEYMIRTMAAKDDYDKYAKDIDAIVKSFKLIEAK